MSLPSPKPTPESAPASPRYSPLVLVAAAMALGICADRAEAISGIGWATSALALLGVWLACFLVRRLRLGSLTLLAAILCGSAAWHHGRWSTYRHDDVGNWASEIRAPVCVRGTLLDQPDLIRVGRDDPFSVLPQYDLTTARIEVAAIRTGGDWQRANGLARLRVVGRLADVRPGDRLLVYGQLSRPYAPRNPGQFDYRGLLRSRRIRAVVMASHPDCVQIRAHAEGLRPRVQLARFRARAERVLWDSLAQERAGLAAALLLGSREQLEDDVEEAFVKTGTMHLLAISGLHLGILAGFFWFWLNVFGVPRRPAAIAVAVLVVGYALLIESRPPVIRATLLVLVACGAVVLDRPVRTANTLAGALVLVLLLNPAELFQTGLQLSFLSAGALLWFGPRMLGRLGLDDPVGRLIYAERPLIWRAGRYVGATLLLGVLVTGVIWCVTLPLIMARFHLLSPVAFVLNVVLIPIVAVVLFCGFGVLVTGLAVPPFVSVFAWACERGIWLIAALVEGASSLTGGHLYVSGPPGWWLAGFYGGLAGLMLSPALRRSTTWWLSAAVLWVGVGLAGASFRPAANRVECVVLDVGHGLASVVHLPNGNTLLYDAGLLGNPRYGGQIVADYFWSRGVRRIDALVLSHADIDHYNAVPYLVERFTIRAVFMAPSFVDLRQRSVQSLIDTLGRRRIPIRFCWSDDRLNGGGNVELRVLHPPAGKTGESDNAASLVLLVAQDDRRLLLTGDLEGSGITELVATPAPTADVLLLPHHGSPAANPPELLRWADPAIVIVSQRRSQGRTLGIEAYRRRGLQALSTAEGGAIAVTLERDGARARYLMETRGTGQPDEVQAKEAFSTPRIARASPPAGEREIQLAN